MARIFHEKQVEVIDRQTGESIYTTFEKSWNHKQKYDKENTFYMCFLNWIDFEYKLTNKAKSILTWLLCHAERDTGIVRLTSCDRKEICDFYKLSNNGLSNLLTELKKNDVITGSNGNFYINPQLFWFGDTSIRNKILKNGNVKFSITIEPSELETDDYIITENENKREETV